MDLKVTTWYAKAKASGVKEELHVEGSFLACNIKIQQWLIPLSVRKGSGGSRTVEVIFSDSPIKDSDQPLTLEQQVMRDLMEMGLGEPDEILDESQTLEVRKSLPPWWDDSLWLQFQHYQFSDRNYSEAAPGEIRDLQTQLRAKYGDDPRLENALIDRRAR